MRSKVLPTAIRLFAAGLVAGAAAYVVDQQQQTGQAAGGQQQQTGGQQQAGGQQQTGRGGRGRGTQIKPGEECPPGTTMTRPGTCQAPEFPAPSILDYRPRNTLVVAQVAVCLVLLVGAALFLRSFIAAQSISPGFDAGRLVTASMDMFPSGYTGERHRDFQRRALEAVRSLPGVRSAAFGSRIPLGFGGNNSTSVAIDGYVPRENEEVVINYSTVGAGYFETMAIPVRQGREYTENDTAESPRVIVQAR